jgi:hypothetical protein
MGRLWGTSTAQRAQSKREVTTRSTRGTSFLARLVESAIPLLVEEGWLRGP